MNTRLPIPSVRIAIGFLLLAATPGFCRSAKEPACTELLSMHLPGDVTVDADKAIAPQTKEAMDYLASRLGFRWHFVGRRSDAMLHVHFVAGAEYMHANRAGEAFTPLSPLFDGVARVRTRDALVVAHEICHVLGFAHSETGLMSPLRSSRLANGLTDDEIHYAALVRMTASQKLRAIN